MNYPKVQLHYHLDGSFPADLFVKYSREQGIIDDSVTDQDWVNSHIMSESMPLVECLKLFGLLTDLLQDYDHLVETTYRELVDEYATGTRLIEIRFAPQLHCQKQMDQRKAVEAVLEGLNKAKAEKPDLVCGILLCMMNSGPEVDNYNANLETVKLAGEYKDKGVVGIDLAGAEGLSPFETFDEHFALAKKTNVNFTLHAGEAGPGENLYYAFKQNTTRIGHGIHGAVIKEIADEIKARNITLEVNVTSNVYAHCVESLDQHPVRQIFDAGIKMNINTDDRFLMGISLESEYQMLKDKFGFTEKELILTNLYGAKASFCKGKETIIEQLENAYKNA